MNRNPIGEFAVADMVKIKRKEITEAKIAARAEIARILDQLRAVSKIPDRIMAADANAASEFKNLLEEVSKKKQCSYQYGSLDDLTKRIASLRALLRSIT